MVSQVFRFPSPEKLGTAVEFNSEKRGLNG